MSFIIILESKTLFCLKTQACVDATNIVQLFYMKLLVYMLQVKFSVSPLTLRLLMSYIYGAPSKARNANVVYIWTYVWQR